MEEAGWLNLMALFLNIWEIRIAVLSSFAAHLVLVLLAGIRRRKASGVRMLILWLAYQLSNWVAPYALSNLSLGNTSRRQQLVAFWATFLMHHLAGPDNISAFSLEDNELSWREVLNVFTRVAGASYDLYKHVYLGGGGGALIPASVIIFSVGVAKYVERAFALWRGDLGNFRSSSEKKKKKASRFRTGWDIHELDDEQAMMVAHDMFSFCKRAMADSSVEDSPAEDEDLNTSRKMFTLGWQNMCKVVEIELSLMYDILFTKAAVVHTWVGYGIRVASPLAIATATVLFWSFSKEGQTILDVVITYALLAATLLLDMRWLLRALGSTWMHAFLQARPHRWIHHAVLCTGRWRRLRRLIVSLDLGRLTAPTTSSPSSYRSWSGTIGQYSLLHECTRNQKISTCARAAKAMGLEDVWNEYQHSKGNKLLDDDVQQVVFTRVRELLMATYEEDNDGRYTMKHITTYWGKLTAKRRQDKLKRFRLAFGGEFQEDILVWHIATQVFLIRRGSDQSLIRHDKNAATHVKAIKVLSEYLMFLIAVRRGMLPGLVLLGLYEVTFSYLQEVWSKHDKASSSSSSTTTKEEKLAEILHYNKNADSDWALDDDKARPVSDATNLAIELLKSDESEMPQLLELVFNVWVDKLLYAATRCSPESHAKQLSRGGDLTTIIWIMAQHAGPFQIGQHSPDDEISDDEISDDEMQQDEKRPEKRKAGDKKEKEAEEKKKKEDYRPKLEQDYPPHMYPLWPEFWVGPPESGGHKPWMDQPVDLPIPPALDEPQETKPPKRRRERRRRYATLYPVD